jgi:protein-S-isoprenylcysteine O-methyltransferase Ste14
VGLALLLIVLSIVVSGLRIPRVDNLPQIITMVIVAVLLTAALIAIYTLDRPFGGVTAIPPTAMERTQEDITEDFVELYGADRLPCDDQGNRKTEGASRASG